MSGSGIAGDGTGSNSTSIGNSTGTSAATTVSTSSSRGWLWVTAGSGGQQALTQPLPGWQETFVTGVTKPLGPVQMIIGTRFPDGGWDPLLKAGAIAAAFAASPDWVANCDRGPPDDTNTVLLEKEEQELLNKNPPGNPIAPARIAEIQAQAQDFSLYWANLLSCSTASRPATWTVVLTALQVAGLVGAYFKLKYERARPAQVWTGISPVIPTPPHPSYPGGHALQAHLIAACVEAIVPAMSSASKVLAARIAENREIAGVHFPSDTKASIRMVKSIFNILSNVEQFRTVSGLAEGEWGRPTNVAPPTPPATKDTGGSPP